MNKEDNHEHEHWFARCLSLGWTRSGDPDGCDSVTSPRGVTLTWDASKSVFKWNRTSDRDFVHLVNVIITRMNAGMHNDRMKISVARQTTRELLQVIAEEKVKTSFLDKWTEEDGKLRLAFFLGPLEVDSTVTGRADGKTEWSVVLSNGQMRYEADGTEESVDSAKMRIYEHLMEWSDEITDTGRYAMKLFSRVQALTE
jgi:hypothetical protein